MFASAVPVFSPYERGGRTVVLGITRRGSTPLFDPLSKKPSSSRSRPMNSPDKTLGFIEEGRTTKDIKRGADDYVDMLAVCRFVK